MSDIGTQIRGYFEATTVPSEIVTEEESEVNNDLIGRLSERQDRHFGRLGILAAAAIVVIGGVAGVIALHSSDKPIAVQTVSPQENLPLDVETSAVADPSTPIEAPILDQSTNSIIYFSTDDRLTIVDVDAATVINQELPELAGGDPTYRLIRRGESLVFYGQTPAGAAAYALDPSTPTKPVLIDDAWFFIPSAVEDRVWLATLDLSSPSTVRALESVREVTVDGTITSDDLATPDGRWPVGAVYDGLVFQGEQILEIWDLESQKLLQTLPGPFPVATWHNRLVTCGQQCDKLTLIDLDSDTQRDIDLPEGVASVDGYGGAFSPDGRFIAVPGFTTQDRSSSEARVMVVLIDFETGAAITVPGILGDPFVSPRVVWDSIGEWLFSYVGALSENVDELFAYRPEDPSAYRVPVVLDGPYYAMAGMQTATVSVGIDNSVLAPRGEHSVTWTGEELLIWGGSSDETGTEQFADGASYDPASDSWEFLPPGPLGPRRNHLAIWTGEQLLISGAREPSSTGSALYNPETLEWTSLSDPPNPLGKETSSVVVGDAVYMWNPSTGQMTRFDLTNSQWSESSPTDMTADVGHLVSLDGQLYAIGSPRCGTVQVEKFDALLNSWQTFPAEQWRSANFEVCLGAVIVAGDEIRAWGEGAPETPPTLLLNPEDGSWAPEPGPQRSTGCENSPAPKVLNGMLFLVDHCANSIVTTDLGDPLPGILSRDSVWTGTEIITWGNSCCYGTSNSMPFEVETWRFRP